MLKSTPIIFRRSNIFFIFYLKKKTITSMEIIKRSQEEWDLFFLNIAREYSKISKDPTTKVGAIIVDSEKRLASAGFNGFPKDIPDYTQWYTDRSIKYSLIKHAEENALAYLKEIPLGATIYVYPLYPCARCTELLRNYNIKRIVTVKHEDPCTFCKGECVTKRWPCSLREASGTIEFVEYTLG